MPNKKLNVHEIDFKYRKYLRKICIESLSFYRGLPITWEDIYNNFLYEAMSFLEEYQDDSKITIQTFLGIKCKYFAQNFCRSFQTNKHKIMNDSVAISNERLTAISDSVELPDTIDLGMFTEAELIVYRSHFLDGKPYGQVQEETGMTRYKVKALAKIIQTKMFSKLKN